MVSPRCGVNLVVEARPGKSGQGFMPLQERPYVRANQRLTLAYSTSRCTGLATWSTMPAA